MTVSKVDDMNLNGTEESILTLSVRNENEPDSRGKDINMRNENTKALTRSKGDDAHPFLRKNTDKIDDDCKDTDQDKYGNQDENECSNTNDLQDVLGREKQSHHDTQVEILVNKVGCDDVTNASDVHVRNGTPTSTVGFREVSEGRGHLLSLDSNVSLSSSLLLSVEGIGTSQLSAEKNANPDARDSKSRDVTNEPSTFSTRNIDSTWSISGTICNSSTNSTYDPVFPATSACTGTYTPSLLHDVPRTLTQTNVPKSNSQAFSCKEGKNNVESTSDPQVKSLVSIFCPLPVTPTDAVFAGESVRVDNHNAMSSTRSTSIPISELVPSVNDTCIGSASPVLPTTSERGESETRRVREGSLEKGAGRFDGGGEGAPAAGGEGAPAAGGEDAPAAGGEGAPAAGGEGAPAAGGEGALSAAWEGEPPSAGGEDAPSAPGVGVGRGEGAQVGGAVGGGNVVPMTVQEDSPDGRCSFAGMDGATSAQDPVMSMINGQGKVGGGSETMVNGGNAVSLSTTATPIPTSASAVVGGPVAHTLFPPVPTAMDVLTQHLLNNIGPAIAQHQQHNQVASDRFSGYSTPIGGSFVASSTTSVGASMNGGKVTFPSAARAVPAAAATFAPPPPPSIAPLSRSGSGISVVDDRGRRSIRLRLTEEIHPEMTKEKILFKSFRRNRTSVAFNKKSSTTGKSSDGNVATVGSASSNGAVTAATKEIDRGSIGVSWYDGTTTFELQDHVRKSIVRHLGKEVDNIRLLDEDVEPGEVIEVVLTPHIPNGSRFTVKFTVPPPTTVKTVFKYGEKAPDSPSAAPSPVHSNLDLSKLPKLMLSEREEVGHPIRSPQGRTGRKRLISKDDSSTIGEELQAGELKHVSTGNVVNSRDQGVREAGLSSTPKEKVLVIQASRSQEKKHVIFVISNYFVLFLSFIVIMAELHDRAPRWIQEHMGRVNACSVDRDALFECISNGDVSGLIASFLMWVTKSTATNRFFLFGFSSRQQLWTVIYEALVTAVCWGTSYMFIRRGLNPDTRTNFLQRYWKDAVYGSLAGFNAYFMKAVLKNLIPQEVLEDVLETRQLRIIDWIAKLVNPAGAVSKSG